MMSIRFPRRLQWKLPGRCGDWLTPPPSLPGPQLPGRHDEQGMGTLTGHQRDLDLATHGDFLMATDIIGCYLLVVSPGCHAMGRLGWQVLLGVN
jgi:hypothetical protein